MFKDNDVTCNRVQTLEERLQDLDQPRSHLGGGNRRDPGYERLESLSLNFWLTKFIQEVANETGVCHPPLAHVKVN